MMARKLMSCATCVFVMALGLMHVAPPVQAGSCLATPGTAIKPRDLTSLIIKRKSYNPHIAPLLEAAYKICVAGEMALRDAKARYPTQYQIALKARMEENPRYRPRTLVLEPNWSTIGYSTEEKYFDGQRYARAAHDTEYKISEDGDCALITTPLEYARIETEKETIRINVIKRTVERQPHLISEAEIKHQMAKVPPQTALALARGFEMGKEVFGKYWPLKGERIAVAGECCRYNDLPDKASTAARSCVLEEAPFFHGYRKHLISLRDEPLGVDGGAWTEATYVELDARVDPAVFEPKYYDPHLRPPPTAGGNP